MNHENALLKEIENLKAQERRQRNRADVNKCRLRAERKERKKTEAQLTMVRHQFEHSQEQRRTLNSVLSDKGTEIMELRGQIRELESEAREAVNEARQEDPDDG